MSLFGGRHDKRSDKPKSKPFASPFASPSPSPSLSPSPSPSPSTQAAGSRATVGNAAWRTPSSADAIASEDVTPDRSGRARRGPAPQGGTDVANLGKSVVFRGELSGEEDLEIEGRVEGKIDFPNHQLTIGVHGHAEAEVRAKTVIVIGQIVGNVTATERCEVQASGVVEGDISAPRLSIQEGAVVNGNISMGEKLADSTQRDVASARQAS